ncbi:glycoside hydrolase family 68 protein [Sphingomonas flavalba]|uniref:glycoside hydrolase family 68 protein n=1 Tax=Sphingomonas flavalba TaxID=2559804 RepID=UPI0039E14C70
MVPGLVDAASPPPVHWSADHVAAITAAPLPAAPLFSTADFARVREDIDIWDAWPLQLADGTPARLGADGGDTLWMALAAPPHPDPDARHGVARIHLLRQRQGAWAHIGPAMPDGFSPGSREWSGSALLDPDSAAVTLYFTATGRRGEAILTFEQRLFQATATLDQAGGYRLIDWRGLRPVVVADPRHYMPSDAGTGTIGSIKAFRDPAYFRDPADGSHHLFFAASLVGSGAAFNGAIGTAAAPAGDREDWRLLPPLIGADGLNNELERPHAVFHAGLYYLFWSTQAHVFAPGGPAGPTGLYGMASPRLAGGWRPLNGTGLVFANPADAPKQAYSWLVLPDLSVTSFVDQWGADAASVSPPRFGASFAPTLHIELDGYTARLAG